MLLGFLGDAHFGARNNSDFFLRKQSDFYSQQWFPYLNDNKIRTVIQFGDLLDQRKFINVRTLNFFKKEYLEKYEEYGIDHYVILGNHDIYHDNTSRLSALREVVEGGIYPHTHLIDTPQKITFDNAQFDFIPWINALISRCPIHTSAAETMDFINASAADVCIGHLEINGFEMAPGIKCTDQLSIETFKHYKYVGSGHFHTQSKFRNIHYVGTPYEMSWADFGKRKGFHVFDTTTLVPKFIKNQDQLYHKIIYNDTSVDYDTMTLLPYRDTYVRVEVDEKENDMMFERFIDNLQRECYELLISDSDSYDFNGDDIDTIDVEDSLSFLIKTVDSMDVPDKPEIKKKIKEIHEMAETALEEI